MKGISMPQVLLLLCLVLAAVIALELRGGPEGSWREPLAAGSGTADLPPLPPANMSVYTAPALTQFREVITRPLFTEDRRPPTSEGATPVAEEPVAAATEPRDVTLSAIVIVGERRTALFHKARTGETLRRAQGEEIDGWVVERIAPDAVAVTSNGQRHEFALRDYPELGQSLMPTAKPMRPARSRPPTMPMRPPRRP